MEEKRNLIRTWLRHNLELRLKTRLGQYFVSIKAFTLIELLVVVTIIAILAGLLLVAFQNTRQSARDGKRKSDLEQIRNALEMYHSDCGRYPNSLTFGGSLAGSGVGTCPSLTYMALVPDDPLTAGDYSYLYTIDPTDEDKYILCSYMETESNDATGCGVCNQTTSTNCNYKLTNP